MGEMLFKNKTIKRIVNINNPHYYSPEQLNIHYNNNNEILTIDVPKKQLKQLFENMVLAQNNQFSKPYMVNEIKFTLFQNYGMKLKIRLIK